MMPMLQFGHADHVGSSPYEMTMVQRLLHGDRVKLCQIQTEGFGL